MTTPSTDDQPVVPPTPEPTTRHRPSPALILFLVFPLLGLIAAGIVMATSGGLAGGAASTPEPVTLPPPKAAADSPMIDFTLMSLEGQTISLSDYQGRVVFLNFWATWCVPCQKELPEFEQFQAQQPPDGAVILAVNVQEGADQVTNFLTDHDISGLTVLLDTDSAVANSYGIYNLPVTFVIDQNGIVRYPKFGAMTVADLQSYLDTLNAS